jgi:hypothetical protein
VCMYECPGCGCSSSGAVGGGGGGGGVVVVCRWCSVVCVCMCRHATALKSMVRVSGPAGSVFCVVLLLLRSMAQLVSAALLCCALYCEDGVTCQHPTSTCHHHPTGGDYYSCLFGSLI